MRLFIILTIIAAFLVPAVAGPPQKPFPVKPHSDVTIEWWYLNAHVTTRSGEHLAMIASFFRFGNAQGHVAKDSTIQAPQSHYLIWAITDQDTGKHVAYSLGDKNTLDLLKEAATLELYENPNNSRAQALLQFVSKNMLPPPSELIGGNAKVSYPPFDARYGSAGEVDAVPGKPNTYRLTLGAGDEHLALTFASQKAPMYVGGNGETGIYKPSDMHYVSLTRCAVAGEIDGEKVKSGQGWIDHQWGDSWTTQTVGWDWWGVQLNNGTDINFFRMRDLATGKTFQPMATFEDSSGKTTVTRDITFRPDPGSVWTSPRSGIRYPLAWTITFPNQHLQLLIRPDIQDQEMPVLANGGYIWEGPCRVTADTKYGLKPANAAAAVAGVAYQELVGYGSPAVAAQESRAATSRSR